MDLFKEKQMDDFINSLSSKGELSKSFIEESLSNIAGVKVKAMVSYKTFEKEFINEDKVFEITKYLIPKQVEILYMDNGSPRKKKYKINE